MEALNWASGWGSEVLEERRECRTVASVRFPGSQVSKNVKNEIENESKIALWSPFSPPAAPCAPPC